MCLTQARIELINVGLIAYQHPLYQVLSIEPPVIEKNGITPQRTEQFQAMKQILTTLGDSHDRL